MRKEESGGEKERATPGMTWRDTVPPSSGFLDGGIGSKEGSLIGELYSDPEVMLWWIRRFQ